MVKALSCIVTLLFLSACSRPDDSTDEAGRSDFEFSTPNGMTVRMIVNQGSGLVASNVFVGAGSTRETEATAGSSHFLEHLLFNGTSTMSQEELYAAADRIGAYNNATTRQEYTHYMMVTPKEELRAALGIQSAMLLDSVLPENKFEKERGIVLEEMNRDADSPNSVRQRRIDSILEADEPDFLRPVLGTPESIAALRRPDVLAYYHEQYVPSNMKLLMMGDFDPEQARALIDELFSSNARAQPWPAAQARWPQSSFLTVDGSEDELTTVVVQMPAPGVEDSDFVPMELMADVLGGGQSGHIRSAFDGREELEIQEVSAGLVHRQGHSLLEIRVSGAPDPDGDAVVALVLGELATMARTGLQTEEWTQARDRALAASIRQIEQLHYYALLQGDLIWHSSAGFEARYQNALANSHAAIARAARTWFSEPILKIAVLAPGKEESSRVIRPQDIGYVAREGAEVGRPMPEDDASGEPVPVVRGVQAPTVTTLENGLTVVHSASPSTRMFAIHVLVRDRSAREPVEHPGMADLLHRCLPEGAGPYDREEFSSLLDAIGGELKVTDSGFIPYDDYYATDPGFSFLRLDCVDLYWKEAVRLTAVMLGEARYEDDAVDRAREQLGQRVRQDAASTAARAEAEFNAALYGPDDPRSRPVFGREGSLDGIHSEQMRSFAKTYLDPAQIVISIVGNVGRDAVLEEIRALMNLPASDRATRAPVPPLAVTAESQRSQIDMAGKQTNIRMGRVIEIDPADRWALEVAVMVASDRMQQELRETRGWAYSLGIGTEVAGDRAKVVAQMGTRPEVAGEAEAAMREWLCAGSLDASEDEIAAAVNSHLGRARMRRVTSIGRAFNLGFDLFSEGSVDAASARTAGLRAVGIEDVARIGGLYFREGPMITVVVQ